jgi:hypothetical protein
MTDKQEHDTATLEILTKRLFNHLFELEALATEIVTLTNEASIPFVDKYKVSDTFYGISQSVLECWAQSDEWCAGG